MSATEGADDRVGPRVDPWLTPVPVDVSHDTARPRSTWEYRDVALPRGTGRDAARAAFVEAAELGRWELARVRLHPDGRRTVRLRRRILRATRTA